MAPRDTTGKQIMRDIMKELGSATATQLFDEMKRRGAPIVNDTIWQYMMSLVVNLPPAWERWPHVKDKFLFLRENGMYELYDKDKHGVYNNGQLVPPGTGTKANPSAT